MFTPSLFYSLIRGGYTFFLHPLAHNAPSSSAERSIDYSIDRSIHSFVSFVAVVAMPIVHWMKWRSWTTTRIFKTLMVLWRTQTKNKMRLRSWWQVPKSKQRTRKTKQERWCQAATAATTPRPSSVSGGTGKKPTTSLQLHLVLLLPSGIKQYQRKRIKTNQEQIWHWRQHFIYNIIGRNSKKDAMLWINTVSCTGWKQRDEEEFPR